ncbi:MAG TPA: FHA domain-containing protein [Pyrinomonadaceae bacterium]|nr:FHA domain-containing protein [Pyrinomonadaceae bacterium]
MKITLIEERGEARAAERSFQGSIIKVGRDASECQIVFDGGEWPMVSRRHAEFRSLEKLCVLVDNNSTFGTYVEGQRVAGPTEARAGLTIQFGTDGPVIRITRIDLDSSSDDEHFDNSSAQEMSATSSILEKDTTKSIPPLRQPQPALLEFVSGPEVSPKRIIIEKDVITLGRAPELDVAVEVGAAVVSRCHAEVRRNADDFVVGDRGSFNGTLLNGQRIAIPTPLNDGDLIQLGPSGPVLRFVHHGQQRVTQTGIAIAPDGPSLKGALAAIAKKATIVKRDPDSSQQVPVDRSREPVLRVRFNDKSQLSIGRAEDNDIRLDGLQISSHHARVLKSGGDVVIEDNNSTNGVYVDGKRLSGKELLRRDAIVQIGPFLLQADAADGVQVFDTRSKTRIDVLEITKVVPNNVGSGTITLLDGVNLSIQPNEFVGLLGPSGAGKSTLMDALNGMRPATRGQVLINNLDLYRYLDSLKQSIGYVPQDDIIHRELTVYRTLYYVGRLRLSRDVSEAEIDQIVTEVMDVTGLSERRDVPISQLSGGQRKRVSIAVELITKPSVIFLDEPTSGLDPATEEKVMVLFRQIAESGRTVILTTHAMENVKLFDKIVVLMRGKLVFYGAPQRALEHVGASSFKDLYDKLEAPIEQRIADLSRREPGQIDSRNIEKGKITEEVAEEWKRRFVDTNEYDQNVRQRFKDITEVGPAVAPARPRRAVTDAIRQWRTLSQRYREVLSRDKFNLFILFVQAPIIAVLTALVVARDAPRDFAYFMLALVAVWFGASVAAREIIRERAVYSRERMVNLGLLPYVCSKLWVLSRIVGLQCLLLFATLKVFDFTGVMKMPGIIFGLPQFAVMLLTAMVGVALGLFVSALVRTSEMATSLIPLILIPQILFSGLVGVPKGPSRWVGVLMPATWSFDEMKRLSKDEVKVLRGKEEGAEPATTNDGRGLYKQTEHVNNQRIDEKHQEIEDYRARSEARSQDFEREMEDYQNALAQYQRGLLKTEPTRPRSPLPDPAPAKVKVERIPDDLSDYVEFLHLWGGVWLNPLVLLTIFMVLVLGTVRVLRSRDVS